jgi:hypothetical protein
MSTNDILSISPEVYVADLLIDASHETGRYVHLSYQVAREMHHREFRQTIELPYDLNQSAQSLLDIVASKNPFVELSKQGNPLAYITHHFACNALGQGFRNNKIIPFLKKRGTANIFTFIENAANFRNAEKSTNATDALVSSMMDIGYNSSRSRIFRDAADIVFAATSYTPELMEVVLRFLPGAIPELTDKMARYYGQTALELEKEKASTGLVAACEQLSEFTSLYRQIAFDARVHINDRNIPRILFLVKPVQIEEEYPAFLADEIILCENLARTICTEGENTVFSETMATSIQRNIDFVNTKTDKRLDLTGKELFSLN